MDRYSRQLATVGTLLQRLDCVVYAHDAVVQRRVEPRQPGIIWRVRGPTLMLRAFSGSAVRGLATFFTTQRFGWRALSTGAC